MPASVLLVGHPNVGKSALFNQLTDEATTESNYPGTTVDYTEGTLTIGSQSRQVLDLPGTFSLEPTDTAEEVAVSLLDDHPDAIVVCVIAGTQIERGLNLVLSVSERSHQVVVVINMWDEVRKRGIDIDIEQLESLLGVPVVPTVATTGKGIHTVVDRLTEAQVPDLAAIATRVQPENPA